MNRHFRALTALLFLAVTFGLSTARADTTINTDAWVVGGLGATHINAMARGNDGTLYVGGKFDYVGPNTGGAANFDPGSTVPANFPKVNGKVYAILWANNGWYIGGDFTSVGGVSRNNAAFVNSSGNVGGWNPNTNGAVRTIYSAGSLYIGGEFTTVGGLPRNHIAALNQNGDISSWNPNANGNVFVIKNDGSSGGALYVGGSFQNIGGQSRSNIAAIAPSTGLATSWNPGANAPVRGLAFNTDASSELYIRAAGDFTSFGGQPRNYLARITASGTVLSDYANLNINGPIRTMVSGFCPQTASSVCIYIGGDFTSVGGETRNHIAAIFHQNTTVQLWDWSPNVNGAVNAIINTSSNQPIYVGGEFTSIDGNFRNYLASFDNSTGQVTNWTPNANGAIDALSIGGTGNSTLGVGGEFSSFYDNPQNQNRYNAAAFNPATGVATPWNPGVDNEVTALAVDGSTVYVGGKFSQIGGSPKRGLAAVTASTGVTFAQWTANLDAGGFVSAIAANSNSIYVGGSFDTVQGQSRKNLAKVNTSQRVVDGDIATVATADGSWNPNVNGPVQALALASGALYVGGDFSNVGLITRHNLAAVSATGAGGTFDLWDPNMNDPVNALALDGSTLYVGGSFTAVGQVPSQIVRNRLAAITNTSDASGLHSALASWNPNANGTVNALGLDNHIVYAGGDFTVVGSQSRNRLAEINGGSVSSWNPGADGTVASLAASQGTVYAGGSFHAIGGAVGNGFAQFLSRPTVQFLSASAQGPESSASPSVVIVLSQATTSAVSVNYTVTGGSASRGEDFNLDDQQATFTVGQTAIALPLTIVDDHHAEGDETIVVTLSNLTGASFGANGTFVYTITDNDVPVCRNGFLEVGEGCDDGNDNDDDACRNTCVSATCGDGVVQNGVEQCDDANTDDTDACRNNCALAACGDGVLQSGIEACDDGNNVDTDACRSDCTLAFCGDGAVQTGVEQCDGGDGCLSDCTLDPSGPTGGGSPTDGSDNGDSTGGNGDGNGDDTNGSTSSGSGGGCSLIR